MAVDEGEIPNVEEGLEETPNPHARLNFSQAQIGTDNCSVVERLDEALHSLHEANKARDAETAQALGLKSQLINQQTQLHELRETFDEQERKRMEEQKKWRMRGEATGRSKEQERISMEEEKKRQDKGKGPEMSEWSHTRSRAGSTPSRRSLSPSAGAHTSWTAICTSATGRETSA